jgi:hypothetical protein
MKYMILAVQLCLMAWTSTRADESSPGRPFTPATIAEIRLDADQQRGLEASLNKAVQFSSAHASKFKIVPGLKDPSLVSFQAAGMEGCYLRHQKFVLLLHRQPKTTSVLFEADASFKLVHLEGDKVRLEACNYPGFFVTARNDGSVVIEKDPPRAESTFFLRATTD